MNFQEHLHENHFKEELLTYLPVRHVRQVSYRDDEWMTLHLDNLRRRH